MQTHGDELIRYWQSSLRESAQLVFVMDTDCRVMAVSDALCAALGHPAGEIVGQRCTPLLHEGADCPPECPLHDVLASGAQRHADVFSEVLQKDLFVTLTPLPDRDGRLELILHTAADVTERKRVEGALRRSEALLRESQRVAKLGHYVLDIPAGTWTSSQALDEVFGIGPDHERTVAGWLQIVHPDDRPVMESYLHDHVLRDREAFDRVYRVRRVSDGSTRWVHGLGTLETGEDGRLTRMFGVIQDITERYEASSALRRSAKLLEEAERIAHLGSWEWDVDSGVTRYSREWQRIYGVDEGEIANDVSLSLIHPEDRGLVQAANDDVLRGDRPYYGQYRIIRQDDGEVRHVEVFGEAVAGPDGRVARVFGASLDVTDKVRAQEALLQRERQLQELFSGVVGALISTVEMRDPYTSGHQNRVAELAVAVARRLGWDENRIADLRTAALLHDIGKVVVPSEILTKPSRLSLAEFSLIKDHAAAGGRILSSVEFAGPVQTAIVQHHERLDGSGYPAGLPDEDIIPEARVLAVADVYEAMISHRPYRPGLPPDAALEELKSGAGRIYDARAAEACIAVTQNGFAFRT